MQGRHKGGSLARSGFHHVGPQGAWGGWSGMWPFVGWPRALFWALPAILGFEGELVGCMYGCGCHMSVRSAGEGLLVDRRPVLLRSSVEPDSSGRRFVRASGDLVDAYGELVWRHFFGLWSGCPCAGGFVAGAGRVSRPAASLAVVLCRMAVGRPTCCKLALGAMRRRRDARADLDAKHRHLVLCAAVQTGWSRCAPSCLVAQSAGRSIRGLAWLGARRRERAASMRAR